MSNLDKAINIATKQHQGQKRKSGEDYIIHPLAVMGILEKLWFEEGVLICAVLHDVCEDTTCSNFEISNIFGKRVGFVINQLSKNHISKKAKLKKDYQRKLSEDKLQEFINYHFLLYINRFYQGIINDEWIVFIKIADQIHNVSTLKTMPQIKRKRKIEEIEQFFIPIYKSFFEFVSEKYQESYKKLLDELFVVSKKAKIEFNIVTSDNPQVDIIGKKKINLKNNKSLNNWIFMRIKKDKEKLLKLKEDLEFFRKKLDNEEYSLKQDDFFNNMQDFWKYISDFEDEKLFNIFQGTDYYQKYREFFADKEFYYVRALEMAEADLIKTKFVGQSVNNLNDNYIKENYSKIIDEIELLDFNNCKKLIIVWSWPFPETVLFIRDNIKLENIIALDRDPEAIQQSWAVLSSLGIEDIKPIWGEGDRYDYHDADIVIIANSVQGKQKILERIVKTAEREVQVLIRKPIGFGKMLYENISEELLPPGLTLIKKGHMGKYFLVQPLVFGKINFGV